MQKLKECGLPHYASCRHGFDAGASPSGKAHGFGPCIRGFESLRPSQIGLSRAIIVFLDRTLIVFITPYEIIKKESRPDCSLVAQRQILEPGS